MKIMKNFGEFVNESYAILEGKEHTFANSAYRKIADNLDIYDISDGFYNNIFQIAMIYYTKKKDKSTIEDFMSSNKAKIDKLIEAEKKKAEKLKNKEIKSTKGKDYEKDPLPADDEEDEDEETED